jgi:hypothetical protein
MKAKKIPCKTENIPMIGEFIVSNAEKDIKDFNNYSSVFTVNYFVMIKTKIEICKELTRSSTVARELKITTLQLYNEIKNLRAKLNALERYLKLRAGKSNIALNDIGLKNVKRDITRHNIEGLLLNMKTSLIAVKQNLPALKLKQTLIDEIETQLQKISSLNLKQNTLAVKCNKFIIENIDKFYDLWNSLKSILVAARAIYHDVDEVKLKDYTIAQLKKKVNAKI